MQKITNMKVSLALLVFLVLIGSAGLTALGSLLPAQGPLTIFIGSMIGALYAFAVTRWYAGQPEEKRKTLNPHMRWPDAKTRNLRVIPVIVAWFIILFASFNYLPAMTQPALGALSVAGLWLIAVYAYNPQGVLADNEKVEGQEKFNWFSYFFEHEEDEGTPEEFLNTDGSIRGRDLPLDAMQQAWEAEQASLADFRQTTR